MKRAAQRTANRLALLAIAPIAGLAACGKTEQESPDAAARIGLERSVADVRAAEAAAAAPVSVAPTAAELTGTSKAEASGRAKAGR